MTRQIQLNLKFGIGDRVLLPEEILKNFTGTIISIWITDTGTQYEVRYFWHCKPEKVYFYEWELERVT